MPCLAGGIIGILSILALYYLYKYADELSDGNIERTSK
jgi:hypothetical protein